MLREPPYPADTRAKGWRFELDHERIRQSDTWALTPTEVRPWLLMLWMTAWEQSPCGSLPASDELIAARIGMPMKAFAKARVYLMRGWWPADDGRMYHDTMAERVGEMLAAKEKEKARKAAYRLKMSQGSPELSHGTDTGHPRDGQGCPSGSDATGTGTGTYISSSLRSEDTSPPRKSAPEKSSGYSDAFEAAWRAYPARTGHSKAEAFKAWNARIAAGVTVQALSDGVKRYAAYCEAERTEPRYVKHAATFFGPDRHYESDWTVQARASPPANDRRSRQLETAALMTGAIRSTQAPLEIIDVEHRFLPS